MTSDRKKPGVAFWATVVVVVGSLYVASFGPACWANQRTGRGGRWLVTVYRPLLRASDSFHCYRPLQWYARMGISDSNLWPWFLDNEKSQTLVWLPPD